MFTLYSTILDNRDSNQYTYPMDKNPTMEEVCKEFGLTVKEFNFCNEYLKDFNAKRALLAAGYTENTAAKKAREVKDRPHVTRYLDHLQKERGKRTRIDQDEVLYRLNRIATRAEKDDDYGPALRALELMGKNLAMFTEKSNITVENPFAAGQSEEDIKKDTERLDRIARLGNLTVLPGGKKNGTEE